ncbi:MAG: hypothetical protein KC643_30825 [Nitrospira sp.]|nr:hypothetical protein [Nitrospira sp.]
MSQEAQGPDRKAYGLRLDQGLMKELKYLGVDQDRNMNDLVEEAIKDLLKKYKKKGK